MGLEDKRIDILQMQRFKQRPSVRVERDVWVVGKGQEEGHIHVWD